ncbi:amino acid permease [Leucobacter sp. OLJS4]|uniref:APC family permease n=1 Tax=unclassified Leucobacter TaxID=2621730 RepID=UPI000C18166C|nr:MULTISPECIES: amino acid permease [unclassified Leucobacter]PIJ55191.1 amino acid permease [Leucobacter sp. OLES1]PII84801.1 amino acid permease [Leucobacter sp. OLCALW19]PII87772.1 amino acid permease [Leucobacter sp. OLTLW20]PII93860.1 amino acid permease [Leucobacter sp. OLAS13]PII98471.1 amino acid permease [Leucobacter sp. OLDS2]
MTSMPQQLLRRKPIPREGEETHGPKLSRSIGLFSLTMIGVGGTVGTGIFFILSEAVPTAGPAVIISFLIAGVVAGLTALCYAELAGSVPVSGSSYSYAYTTLGEMPAMGVAACLLLEYGVSTAAVAVGWSQYVNQLFHNLFGFELPAALSNAPEEGGIINLPAVILIALCALLLIRGTKESVITNTIMVVIKLVVLVFFAAIAFTGWNADHFANFAPFGFAGIMSGAGIIFFSFVGLDAVSTAGEEAKNPKKNLPLALIFALVIVTGIYVLVAMAGLGAQAPEQFKDQSAGLSAIIENLVGASWPGTLVAAGAVISIFSVTLVVLYGQTRILFAMSKDGMMPKVFQKVNPRTMTPIPNTIIVAIATGILAGVIPINFLAEMTSIGTLAAFIVVSLGVIILRRREPDLERGFKVPGGYVIPILSILGCLWIITNLQLITIAVFAGWTALFLLYYFFYARKRSALAQPGAFSQEVAS